MTNGERSTESEFEPIQPSDLVEDTGEKLSLRDALEVAVEASKDESGSDEGVGAKSLRGAAAAETGADTTGSNSDIQRDNEPALQPPAEFTADEKADFNLLSRKQQEAQIRLHKSRLTRLEAQGEWIARSTGIS